MASGTTRSRRWITSNPNGMLNIMNPMAKAEGLVAGLHLNSVPARILLWLHSTLHPSPMRDSGQHDKLPVLPHRGTEYLRERNVFNMDAVLSRPWKHFCFAHREPVTLFRLRAATVSLCGIAPLPQYARTWTSECLLASTELFFSRGEKPEMGTPPPMRLKRPRHSSPWLKPGASWLGWVKPVIKSVFTRVLRP